MISTSFCVVQPRLYSHTRTLGGWWICLMPQPTSGTRPPPGDAMCGMTLRVIEVVHFLRLGERFCISAINVFSRLASDVVPASIYGCCRCQCARGHCDRPIIWRRSSVPLGITQSKQRRKMTLLNARSHSQVPSFLSFCFRSATQVSSCPPARKFDSVL